MLGELVRVLLEERRGPDTERDPRAQLYRVEQALRFREQPGRARFARLDPMRRLRQVLDVLSPAVSDQLSAFSRK